MKLFKLFVFLLLTLPLYGQKAKVFAVHDGDSYKVLIEGDSVKKWIRLYGVDCPEVKSNLILNTQPYGRFVGDTIRKMIKGKYINLEYINTDKYNRMVCKVTLDSVDLSKYIVANGFGWVAVLFKEPDTYIQELEKLQIEAKDKQYNIWSMDEVIHPFMWRSFNTKK